MKIPLIIFSVLIGISLASTINQNSTEEEQEVTTSDVEPLNKLDDDDLKLPEVQKKRESGYSYSKPTRLPVNYRPSPAVRIRIGHTRRPHSRRPNQQTRPFTQYGLPMKPSPVMHQGFVPSTGVVSQGLPSPIRNMNFDEQNTRFINGHTNVQFGRNPSLYLQSNNQQQSTYVSPNTFTSGNNQNFIQQNANNQQISDAALFLSQNAQAISELYGAPASNQEYAPSEDLFDQNNQIAQQNEAGNENDSQSSNSAQESQDFSGSIPAYASGILSNQEALLKLQSLEKDRLIFELQQALVQSKNQQNYPETSQAFSQNFNAGSSSFGTNDTPKFSYSYGVPTLSTGLNTPILSSSPKPSDHPIQSPPNHSYPTPAQPGTIAGFPHYSGYFPSVIPSISSSPSISNFNPGIFGHGDTNIPIKPIDTPTHFGIPLPTRPHQKPSILPNSPGVSHLTPVIPSRPTAASVPVHPISTPFRPVRPDYPLPTPVRPVVSVNPVTPIQPVVTPIIGHQGHTLGFDSTNPLVYKPVKAVYPFYYPGQKAISPMQPWV